MGVLFCSMNSHHSWPWVVHCVPWVLHCVPGVFHCVPYHVYLRVLLCSMGAPCGFPKCAQLFPCVWLHGVPRMCLSPINPIFKFFSGSRRKIHLSFDIDSLDPEYARSTGTPGRNPAITIQMIGQTVRLININFVMTSWLAWHKDDYH